MNFPNKQRNPESSLPSELAGFDADKAKQALEQARGEVLEGKIKSPTESKQIVEGNEGAAIVPQGLGSASSETRQSIVSESAEDFRKQILARALELLQDEKKLDSHNSGPAHKLVDDLESLFNQNIQ